MSKILISAFDCAPGRGSEEEIGWSVVNEISKRHIVWVITRSCVREEHEAAFKQGKKPNTLYFLYYDLPKCLLFLKRGKYLRFICYYFWQIGSYFEARRFLKRQSVDFVHHLTKCMDWMPSGLALLGLPFLWGPVGSENMHPAIWRTLPFRFLLSELLREVIRFFGRNIDPFVLLTRNRARAILSHTPENFSRKFSHKIMPFIQTGIHPTLRFARPKKSFYRGKLFKVIFAGNLVHWKGASYAIEAFLKFASDKKDVRLVVIGEGPLYTSLHQKVKQSALAIQVEFKGHVDMNVLVEELSKCDVFIFPSYHHGLSTVVLQAMLTGLPVICIEGDSHGRTVGTECGITVSLNEGSRIIQLLSSALERLYADESLRIALAKRAQEVAKINYSYKTIGSQYEEVYQRFYEGITAKYQE